VDLAHEHPGPHAWIPGHRFPGFFGRQTAILTRDLAQGVDRATRSPRPDSDHPRSPVECDVQQSNARP